MQYFPIFLDTTDLTCLVVGAGEVAARKVELLLKTSGIIRKKKAPSLSTGSGRQSQSPSPRPASRNLLEHGGGHPVQY